MTVQMIIELPHQQGANTIIHALESYKTRLQASVARSRRRLYEFEARYGVKTDAFLAEMVAEDLDGGDLEYVEWAGEAKLLAGLEAELGELEHARFQFS